MTIRSRLAQLFRPTNFGEVRPDDPSRYLRWLPSPSIAAGVPVTVESAMQLSTVWACVDAITKALAPCRWDVYRVSGRRREVLPHDPIAYVLNVRPNPEMTAISFREALLYNALTWGNGYAEIVFDGAQRVKELWPLLPDRMTPRRRPDTGALYYEYVQMDGGLVDLEPAQVLHVRGPTLVGFLGDNFVARSAKAIGLAIAMERFASSYFANGTVTGTILKYPKTLTEPAYQKLLRDWEERRQGPDKAHKPVILEGGMELTEQVIDSAKAQMIESRKFQVEEICRWFGVPLHKVQHLDRATNNNIEHLGIEFVRDALTPWACRLQQEADAKLFVQRGPQRETRLDMGWLSHGDAGARASAYSAMRNIGVYSVNDIREMEGLNTIGPEGDLRIVPLNMQVLRPELADPPKATPAGTGSGPPGAPPASTGGDATDPEEQEEEGDAGAPSPDDPSSANDLALLSIRAVVASSLARLKRRLSAREADLRRAGANDADVGANLAAELERAFPRITEECGGAREIAARISGVTPASWDARLQSAAAAVAADGEPAEIAGRLVARLVEDVRR